MLLLVIKAFIGCNSRVIPAETMHDTFMTSLCGAFTKLM